MLKQKEIKIRFIAWNDPSGKRPTKHCFLTTDDSNKIFALLGKKFQIQTLSSGKNKSSSDLTCLQTSEMNYFDFGENVDIFLQKLQKYDFCDIVYNHQSSLAIISVKIQSDKNRQWPKLIISDLKKSLSYKIEFQEMKKAYFKSIHFATSSQGTIFAALTSTVPQTILLYDTKKQIIIGTKDIGNTKKLQKIDNNPTDIYHYFVYGNTSRSLLVARINDSFLISKIQLKFHLKKGVGTFEWLTDDIFVVSDSLNFGLVVIQQNSKSKYSILQCINSVKINEINEKIFGESTIIATKKVNGGILVSTSIGILVFFKKTSDFAPKDSLSAVNNIILPIIAIRLFWHHSMSCVFIDEFDSKLLFSFENGGFIKTDLSEFISDINFNDFCSSNFQPISWNLNLHNRLCNRQTREFSMFSSGDLYTNWVCLLKDENLLEILNPQSSAKLRRYITFPSEFKSIDVCEVHPLGMHLLLACSEFLSSFAIEHENLCLIATQDSIKNCYLAKFMKDGSILAVAHEDKKSASFGITIINFFTLEVLYPMNIFISSILITGIVWASKTCKLWIASKDGRVVLWNPINSTKNEVFCQTGTKLLALESFTFYDNNVKSNIDTFCALIENNHEEQRLLVIYKSKTIKVQSFKLGVTNDPLLNFKYLNITAIEIDGIFQGLLFGSNTGTISYIEEINLASKPIWTYAFPSQTAIKKITFSQYQNCLSVYLADGMRLFCQIPHKKRPFLEINENISQTRRSTLNPKKIEDLNINNTFQEAVLVNPETFINFQQKQQNHKNKIKKLKTEHEFHLEHLNALHKNELEKTVFQHLKELEAQKAICDELSKSNFLIKSDCQNAIIDIEKKYLTAMQEIDRLYLIKVASNADQTENEAHKMSLIEKKHKIQLEKIKNQCQKNLEDEKKEFEKKMTEKEEEINLLKILTKNQQQDFEKRFKEVEISKQISCFETNQQFLQEKNDLCLKFETITKENNRLKREAEAFNKIQKTFDETENKSKEKIKNLLEIGDNLNKRNEQLSFQLSILQQNLSNKEKINLNLTKELHDHKIEIFLESKKIEPIMIDKENKEIEINELKNQILKQKDENETICKQNSDNLLFISNKNEKMKVLKNDNKKLEEQITKFKSVFIQIARLFEELIDETDERNWKQKTKQLYQFLKEARIGFLFNKEENFSQISGKEIEVVLPIIDLQEKIVKERIKNQNLKFLQEHRLQEKRDENIVIMSEMNDFRRKCIQGEKANKKLMYENGHIQAEVSIFKHNLRKSVKQETLKMLKNNFDVENLNTRALASIDLPRISTKKMLIKDSRGSSNQNN